MPSNGFLVKYTARYDCHKTKELIRSIHLAGVQTGDAVGRCDDVDVAHEGAATELVSVLAQCWVAIRHKTLTSFKDV